MSVDYSPDPNIKYKTFTSAKHLQLASTAYRYAKQRSVMMKHIKDLRDLVEKSNNNSTLKFLVTIFDAEIEKLTDKEFMLSEEEQQCNNQLETVKLEEELNRLRLSNLQTLAEYGRRSNQDNVVLPTVAVQGSESTQAVVTTKYDKLDSSTPLFHGKVGENVLDWLFIIENNFNKAKVPPEKKLMETVSFVRGAALQMLKNFMLNGSNSWVEFANMLKDSFAPIDLPRRIRSQLKEHKHAEGMTFDHYVKRFLQLANQIDMTEEEKLIWFCDGLRKRTQFELTSRNIVSLQEAIVTATRYEGTMSNGKEELHQNNMVKRVNYVGKVYRPKGKQRFPTKTFSTGNNQSKNKSYYSQNKNNNKDFSARKEITCYKCKQKGHVASKCNRPQVNKLNMIKFDDEDEELQLVNMISIASVNNQLRKLLTIEGSVGGSKMTIGFDSGATASVISKSTANRCGIKLNPSDLKVKTASGEVLEIAGITDPLIIEIRGHTCTLELMAIDHEDHDVLLGLDWFEITGAGLYPKVKTLRFPGETIFLGVKKDVLYNEIESVTDDSMIYGTEDVLVTEVTDEIDIAEESDWSINQGIKRIPVEKLACLRDAGDMFAKGIIDLGACSVFKHVIRTQAIYRSMCLPIGSQKQKEGS